MILKLNLRSVCVYLYGGVRGTELGTVGIARGVRGVTVVPGEGGGVGGVPRGPWACRRAAIHTETTRQNIHYTIHS